MKWILMRSYLAWPNRHSQLSVFYLPLSWFSTVETAGPLAQSRSETSSVRVQVKRLIIKCHHKHNLQLEQFTATINFYSLWNAQDHCRRLETTYHFRHHVHHHVHAGAAVHVHLHLHHLPTVHAPLAIYSTAKKIRPRILDYYVTTVRVMMFPWYTGAPPLIVAHVTDLSRSERVVEVSFWTIASVPDCQKNLHVCVHVTSLVSRPLVFPKGVWARD